MAKAPKLSGNFKSFVDASKKPTRVLGALERHVLSIPDDVRSHTVLHPSDMVSADWCYRASYFHLSGEKPVKKEASFKLRSVFLQGHAIHEKYQNWFRDMGVLYGKWYCDHCGWIDELTLSSELKHEKDCLGTYEYREVPINYEPLRIGGKADGWIVGLGEPLMLEVKSIGPGTFSWEDRSGYRELDYNFEKAWDALNSPFAKHVTQVQLYMKVAELISAYDGSYKNSPQEAVLIYENKSNQDIKEFVVRKSDFAIAHLLEAAKMIVDAVKVRTPPACNISPNGCPRCKGYTDGN
jgi:hypothetical protein